MRSVKLRSHWANDSVGQESHIRTREFSKTGAE